MVFEVSEALISEAGTPLGARSWSVALGLDMSWIADLAQPDCVLEARATASRGPLEDGLTPAGVYPYIEASVPLDTGAALTCSQHPLDGEAPRDGVSTRYTAFDAPVGFAHVGHDAGAGFTTEPLVTTCPAGTLDLDGRGGFCAPPAPPAERTGVVVPYAATVEPSGMFLVTVDDGTRVYDLPVSERMNVGHARFAFTGTVEVEVTYLEPHLFEIGDLVVRPRRHGVPFTVTSDGLTARFTLDGPKRLVIEGADFVDPANHAGPELNPRGKPLLFLFAEALETDPVDPGAPDVVVAEGPGIDPSGLTSSAAAFDALRSGLRAGQTLFVPPGTYIVNGGELAANRNIYVHGSARMRGRIANASMTMLAPRGNNRVHGRGEIDGRGILYKYQAADYNLAEGRHTRLIRGQNADNVRIEDVTLLDSSAFMVWLEECQDWVFQSIKILEYGRWDAWAPDETDPSPWATYPTGRWPSDGYGGMDGEDGINLDGSRRTVLDDSLVFSADSALMIRADGDQQRFVTNGVRLLDDITARNSILYNHGGGSSGAIGFWRATNLFRDITFDNIAAPQAYWTPFLRSRVSAMATLDGITWRGIDYETTPNRGMYGFIEHGNEFNALSSGASRIYYKFALPGPGAYEDIVFELPRGQQGDLGVTIEVYEAPNTELDGVTPWREATLSGVNRPDLGALLQSFSGNGLTTPMLRNPSGGGASFKVNSPAFASWIRDHADEGTVSLAVRLTPTAAPVGNWYFFNDEGARPPHAKPALMFTFDGTPEVLYPAHDAPTGSTSAVFSTETVTDLAMLDLVVKDVSLPGTMEIHNLDHPTRIVFDDVLRNGTLVTSAGHVGARVGNARVPMELSYTSVPDPVIEVFATAPTAVEGGAAGAFTVRRGGGTESAVKVYLLVLGAAKSGVDVAALPSTVEFAPGETERVIPVVALADGWVEPVESVVLEVVNVHRSVAEAAGEVQYVIGGAYKAQVSVFDPVVLDAVDVVGVGVGGNDTSAPIGVGAAVMLVRFNVPAMPALGLPRYAALQIPWAGGDLAAGQIIVTPIEEDVAGLPWTPDAVTPGTAPAVAGPASALSYPEALVQRATGGGAELVLSGEALDAFLAGRASRAGSTAVSFRIERIGGAPVQLGAPRLTFDVVDR